MRSNTREAGAGLHPVPAFEGKEITPGQGPEPLQLSDDGLHPSFRSDSKAANTDLVLTHKKPLTLDPPFKRERRICRLRFVTFWLLVVIVILVVAGAVGGGIGGALAA